MSDRNWSASGHVKMMHRTLRIKEVSISDGTRALVSDGASSDCVNLALTVLHAIDNLKIWELRQQF